MSLVLAMLAGIGLDAWLGEPRRWHPLVGFGRWANRIEQHLRRDGQTNGKTNGVAAGMLAWALAVLPLVVLVVVVQRGLEATSPWLATGFAAVMLYLAVGQRSLGEHARNVETALAAGDLDGARHAVGYMVSRDTAALDATQVAAAATESVLENGSDAVFAALFWFAVLGAPGVVLYRLANTLDAMWGYRTARYLRFGWAAARLDDVLNFVPARLTALTYALLGRTASALRCWRTQGRGWKSPNAGPVMAAGAGALGIQLGGPAPYHGTWQARPALGEGRAADASAISAARRLVNRGVMTWLSLVVLIGIGWEAMHA